MAGQPLEQSVAKLLSTSKTIIADQKQQEIAVINPNLRVTADQFIAGKKNELLNDQNADLKKQKEHLSKQGNLYARYQQTLNGIPVEGATLIAKEKNGRLCTLSGTLVAGLSNSTSPSLTEHQALSQALSTINAKEYAWENSEMEAQLKNAKKGKSTWFPNGELVYVSGNHAPIPPNNNYQLAWKFNIFSIQPHQHQSVYIDAHSGQKISATTLLKDAYVQGKGLSNYHGEQTFTCNHKNNHYQLDNPLVETRRFTTWSNGYGKPINSLDTNWTSHKQGIDVHWGIEKFVHHLNDSLGRNGYDGAGGKIRAIVGLNINNAFWDGHSLWFGKGNNQTSRSLTSNDLVAHEYSHALLDDIIGFHYAGESGAIEESYCDIFGELFEYWETGALDWKVGADVTLTAGVPNQLGIRDLSQPIQYKSIGWKDGPADHWGVHNNSRLHSYWFHRLINHYGVSVENGTELIYETLFNLTPNGDYFSLRNASVLVANSQFPGIAVAVESCWNDVGLSLAPPQVILDVFPANGDVLYGGTTDTIRWDTSLAINDIDIEYSTNGGATWQLIVAAHPYAQGSYVWNIPQNYSNKVLVRVQDSSQPNTRGVSNGYFQLINTTNLPPIALDDEIHTYQDFFEIINPIKNDTDEGGLDSNSLTILTSILPSQGTVELANGGRKIRLTIAPDFVGNFTFDYQVCDLGTPRLCDIATVTIVSHSAQAPKWAMSDWGILSLGETLNRNLLVNDYLVDSTWSFVGWDTISLDKGALSIDASNGDYGYTANTLGRDTICYYLQNQDTTIVDTAYLYLFNILGGNRAKDSMDLVILHEMTDGANWLYPWDLSTPMTDWYGITLLNDRVSSIDLRNNHLAGELSDFSNLTQLRSFYLNENQLTGFLPDYSNLTSIEHLSFSFNSFSGYFPNLSKTLQLLTLSAELCDFIGSPPDFSSLTALESIRFNSNKFNKNMTDYSHLVNLQYLHFYNNKLSGTIPNFSMPNLRALRLGKNNFSGSIPPFTNCTQLDHIDLAFNDLTGPIPHFPNVDYIKYLRINSNKLTGEIPTYFNFKRIESLILYANELTGPIPDLSHLKDLEHLSFSNNNITGSIPSFDSLLLLDHISLTNNQLSGPVPDFSHLPLLEYLSIAKNNLTFEGIENNLHLDTYSYINQAAIPTFQIHDSLVVFAGDTIAENTYVWYMEPSSTPIDTLVGQNYFLPDVEGIFYCEVSNADVTLTDTTIHNLILTSEPIQFLPVCDFEPILPNSLPLCQGDTLDAKYPRMQGYTWKLNDSIIGTSQKITAITSGQYHLELTDSCANVILDSISVSIITDCVWPGDTNRDGIVDHYDLKNIGLHIGATGMPRSSTSTEFQYSYGQNWTDATSTGINLKHVDTNGDGLINSTDTIAILQNYGQSWKSINPLVSTTASPLKLTPEIVEVPQDSTGKIRLKFHLSNTEDSLLQYYGIAWKTELEAPSSVLSKIEVDKMEKEGHLSITSRATMQQIEMALTETDQQDVIIQKRKETIGETSVTTEWDIPSGDTTLLLKINTNAIRLHTTSNSFAPGSMDAPVEGGSTTLYFKPEIAFTVTPTSSYCTAPGTAAIEILKGNGPFSYLWSHGETAATAEELAIGNYQFTVTDGTGATMTGATTIEGIAPLEVNEVLTIPSAGISDGAIALFPNGGLNQYSFLWNTGATASSISNLQEGIYTVLVEDSTACSAVFTFELLANRLPLDVQVFLEGTFDPSTGLMNDVLRSKGVLPIIDPYFGQHTLDPAVLDVTGPTAIVDWILVELRDMNTIATIDFLTVLLRRDGQVVGLDGLTIPYFNNVSENFYYIVVRHRNHLPVMSVSPVYLGATGVTYDFTNLNSFSLNGLAFGQKELTPGIWGLFLGNNDQTTPSELKDINTNDRALWQPANGLFNGYFPEDFNMDAEVTGEDKVIQSRNFGVFSGVPF